MNKEIISKETKQLDILLKIGLAMISISGLIFATSTWNLVANSIKVISLFVFGLLFLGMSIFSEKKLKIKSTTMTYWILSMLFFIFTTVGAFSLKIFGEVFSYIGSMNGICYAITYITTSITSYLTYKKFNKKFFLSVGNVFLYLTFSNLLSSTPLKEELFIAILALTTLIISIICNVKRNDFTKNLSIVSRIMSYMYPLLTINLLFEKINNIYFAIMIFSQMANLTYQALSNKEEVNGVFASLTNTMLLLFINKMHLSSSIILPITFAATSIYVLIGFLPKLYKKNKAFHITNLTINMIMSLFAFGFSFITNNYSMLIIAALLILPSIIALFKNNTLLTNVEKILSPYKYVLALILLIVVLHKEVLEINVSLAISIISIIVGIFYLLAKEKYYKITYLIFYIISLLFSFILPSDKSVITIIANIISSLLLFVIVYRSNNNMKKFTPIATIVSLFSIYYNIVPSDVIKLNTFVLNVIVIVAYLIITLIFNSEKKVFIPTLFMYTIPLISISNYISISYISTILNIAVSFYILALICELLIKDEETKNAIASIFSALILLFSVFNENIYVGIFIGILSVLLILIGIFNKKYKSLYIIGIIYLILNLIYQLRNVWGRIPFWLYLLIVGLLIIGIVTYMQIKISKRPPKRYCTGCGNELNSNDKFCTKCGKHS